MNAKAIGSESEQHAEGKAEKRRERAGSDGGGYIDNAFTQADSVRTGMMGFVEDTATDTVHVVGHVVAEGVHVVRDVATEALDAVGSVGGAAGRAVGGLIGGIIDGVRGATAGMRGTKPPEHRP